MSRLKLNAKDAAMLDMAAKLDATHAAARAMLAALYEIARASTVGEENPERLLRAWRQVNDAVILAEAAGIERE